MSDSGRSGVSPFARLAGRRDDATLFAGVLGDAFTLGDAFALGAFFAFVGVGDLGGPAGFVGVALGVVVRDLVPFMLGEVNMIDGLCASAAGLSAFFWGASRRGVDMTRSRCVGGEGLPAVSDAAVPKIETETDVERAVRRDGAMDGLPCTGALVWRVAAGLRLVVEGDTLGVDWSVRGNVDDGESMVCLRTPPGVGIMGIVLAFLTASDGIGVALGERDALLGVLPGTMVVTPLVLDAFEYARGLARLLDVVRV